MQLLSQGAQYAVSAIISLSRQPDGAVVSAADLAQPLNCPPAYLSQILSKLKPSGILKSQRGSKGGVTLNRSPDEISLLEVVEAVDGDEFFDSCFLGIKGCGEIEPCPFHEIWSNYREQIRVWMKNTNFAGLDENMSDEWFDLRLKFERT